MLSLLILLTPLLVALGTIHVPCSWTLISVASFKHAVKSWSQNKFNQFYCSLWSFLILQHHCFWLSGILWVTFLFLFQMFMIGWAFISLFSSFGCKGCTSCWDNSLHPSTSCWHMRYVWYIFATGNGFRKNKF